MTTIFDTLTGIFLFWNIDFYNFLFTKLLFEVFNLEISILVDINSKAEANFYL